MVPMRASSRPASHDARTTEALARSYGGRLFAYFRFMLGSESESKRAVTDTLMAAAPETGRARDLDSCGPRLFMLARAERRKYQPAEAVGAGQHWSVVTGSGNPVLPEIARRAVARLAPDVREAYILSAPHNDLTLPQLAEILEVGLDAAADLRAQAGLDFVRAVAVCAQEAGYIQFAGADLRIRAEESLAREASEPAPDLPMLSDPALAAFRDDQPPLSRQAPPPPPPPPAQAHQPPRTPLPPPSSLPSALPSSVALPPPSAIPPSSAIPSPPEQALPPVVPPAPPPEATTVEATTVEPAFQAAGGPPTRVDHARPPGYDHGGEPGPGYDAYGGHSSRERRRRKVLAWTGGGVAVAAVAVIGWQILGSGPGNSVTLTHGRMPPTAVPASPGTGGAMSSPPARPTARPSPSIAPSEAASPASVPESAAPPPEATAPAPAAPRPTTAPARRATSPAPRASSPTPVKSSRPARPSAPPSVPRTPRPSSPSTPAAPASL